MGRGLGSGIRTRERRGEGEKGRQEERRGVERRQGWIRDSEEQLWKGMCEAAFTVNR